MPRKAIISPKDKPKEDWNESDEIKAKIEELINKGKICDEMDAATAKTLDPDFQKLSNIVFGFHLKTVRDYMKSK